MNNVEIWIQLGGFIAVLAFLWKLSQDVGDLRERMAKLEGVVEGFIKGQQKNG